MDFGKVPYPQLDKIDFSLPPEPAQNSAVLSGQRAENPGIYIGCPRWGVKEWVGKLYPKGTRDAQFLDAYVKQFNCIELNSTFYNLYDEGTIAKWAAKAGDGVFKFCPKIYQGISHEGTLQHKEGLTHAFEKSITAFGPHLGPAFLQLGDGFGPHRKNELSAYLSGWPAHMSLCVEVRHPGWFAPEEMEGLVQLLQRYGAALVITDTAGRRDGCHMRLSDSKTMVRFVANNLHSSDYTRADEWISRVAHWVANGLTELYFFVHMANEKHSPELVSYFIRGLNTACGISLKPPILLQQELF